MQLIVQFAGQEATVRTRHGTKNWFKIRKGVHQDYIFSPCLFNLYAEYIMRNAWLDEAQAGIKIARRNINNLRYADDTTPMAESEEELKSLLTKVKAESEKTGLNFSIQKTKIMASGPITSWQIGKKMKTVTDFIFLDSQITEDSDCSHGIKRCLLLMRKAMTNLDSVLKSRGRWEGGLGWGIHVYPRLIHVSVLQKPLQYCKVISIQLIKKKKKKYS